MIDRPLSHRPPPRRPGRPRRAGDVARSSPDCVAEPLPQKLAAAAGGRRTRPRRPRPARASPPARSGPAKSAGSSRAAATAGVMTRATLDRSPPRAAPGRGSPGTPRTDRSERRAPSRGPRARTGGARRASLLGKRGRERDPQRPALGRLASPRRPARAPGRPPCAARNRFAHSSDSKARSAAWISVRRPAARGLATRRSSGRRVATATRSDPLLGPEQLAEQAQRLLRAVEVLGVVDHQHERLDQEPRQLGDQLARRGERVELLGAGREPLGERVGGARHRGGDRAHDPQQKHTGGPLVVAAADPRDRRRRVLERQLEDRRLAAAAARGEDQPARVEGIVDPPRGLRPGDPSPFYRCARSLRARGCMRARRAPILPSVARPR